MATDLNTGDSDFTLPLPNPLSKFRSFNYIFTLSCLSNEEINFPESTYKYTNKIGQVILKSGGVDAENRVRTANTSTANPEGKFEYYIDNVTFNAAIFYTSQQGNTNTLKFEFEVIEPYSLGIFLQSLQLASDAAGHLNYFEAPFLLTLEFVGYDDTDSNIQIPNTKRHLPIKLLNANMEVTQSGCKYKVVATAWNEIALKDVNNLLKTDVSISGTTVQEILQTGEYSLQSFLNKRLEVMSKKTSIKSVPDQVLILFPKELKTEERRLNTDEDSKPTVNPKETYTADNLLKRLSVTKSTKKSVSEFVQLDADLNDFGKSKMGFDYTTGGPTGMIGDSKAFDSETRRFIRNRVAYDPSNRVFSFLQGASITSVITEVLLMSEHCKKIAYENIKDTYGFKQWFRIETEVYNLDPGEGNRGLGRVPRLIVYKVVPYNVHSSLFTAITSLGEGYDQLEKQAVKHYDYLYTGKNTEVLNFNINLQAGFLTTLYADLGMFQRDQVILGRQGATVEDNQQPTAKTINNSDYGAGNEDGVGQPQAGMQETEIFKMGGGPTNDRRSLVARHFQHTLLNSNADLLKGELTIMGDPYYVADSGLGNFSNSGTTKYFNITKTGAIDYQNGEVDIILNFRTPIDIDPETGAADFGKSELVQGFSGLYLVHALENHFHSGKFTQTLTISRRLRQTTHTANGAPASTKQTAETESSATVNPSAPVSSNVVTVGAKTKSAEALVEATPEQVAEPGADL